MLLNDTMYKEINLKWKIFFVITIFLCAGFKVNACPKSCSCSKSAISCNGIGLTQMEDNIPESIRFIDLSNNPSIKLEKHVFYKFKQLRYLLLSNCSIKEPLHFPASLRILDLSRNKFGVSSLKTMLRKSNLTRLTEIYLSSNGIHMDKSVFSLLPKGLQVLSLTTNVIPKFARSYLEGFKDVKRLALADCQLREIELGAFDSLKNLKTLLLYDNFIENIPKGLFQFNLKLNELYLRNNSLKIVPDLRGIQRMNVLDLGINKIEEIRDFSVEYVASLWLSYNIIRYFDISKTRFSSLDLSSNDITRIEDFAFSGRKTIRNLFLNKNKISYISPKAFHGVAIIMGLFLQRNLLETLPRGVFRGIAIQNIFLFNNRLKSIEGLLDGMTRPPSKLLLFENPKLTQLRAKDLQTMRIGSTVYTGCTQLKNISVDISVKAKIICSPSNALKIRTPTSTLVDDGFECKFQNGKLYLLCTPCAIGQHGNKGKCFSCPAGGYYQDEMAALTCKQCPLGQYVPPETAPGKSPIDCITCPKGTNTNSSAGYRACPCLEGYARTYRFGECQKCSQKGFACKLDYKELMKGYWMSWNSIRKVSNKSCKKLYISFIQNINATSDLYNRQTLRYNCKMPKPHKCPLKESCLGGINADCRKGYTGVLCAVCSNGFMKNFNKCAKCPSPVIAVVQCVVYVLAFIFVCWVITLTERIKLTKDNDTLERTNQSNGVDRTFADVILSSLKILMGFYQVLLGIFHALDYIQWPTALKTTVNFFEYIQLAIIRIPSLHCIRPEWRMNAISEFYFALIATTSVIFAIFLYFAIKSLLLFRASFNTHEFKERQQICKTRCLRAACLLIFATYPVLSSHIVKILPPSCHRFCTIEDNGKCLHEVSFLRSDYSVRCLKENSSMTNTLIVAYVTLVLPIGFPFALFLLLWRFARHSETLPQSGELTTPIDDDETYLDDNPYFNATLLVSNRNKEGDACTFALKFAYENYTVGCWYWEVLETLRKLIMIVGIALFLQHTKVGLGSMIIIAIIFTTLHAIKSPIKDKFENFLQLLSLSIIPINLAIGAILHSTSVGDESIIGERDYSWALGILLIVLNSLLIIFVIIRLLRAIIKKCSSGNAGERQHSCCRRLMGYFCTCAKLAPINSRLTEMDRVGEV